MEPIHGVDVKNIAAKIQDLVENDESGVLVLVITSLGSAPGKVGSKMLVMPDGNIHGTIGGGVVEARVMADALDALEDGHGPRTKDYDLDELGILKVDCLALGMLTAVRKCFELIERHHGRRLGLADIPEGDRATYAMIRRADTMPNPETEDADED